MKIIIAPDSFKESLSASAVADAIERGLRRALPDAQYVKLPIADGGEGTVDALINATAGQLIFVPVTGPMGRPVNGFLACWGMGKRRSLKWPPPAVCSGWHRKTGTR
jgi:glycerate kinase